MDRQRREDGLLQERESQVGFRDGHRGEECAGGGEERMGWGEERTGGGDAQLMTHHRHFLQCRYSDARW